MRAPRMMIHQPPAFPGNFLTRVVPAWDHEPLLGDLFEEYQRRRSVTWYCVQILSAIVIGSWRDIRSHKLTALRAAAVGIVMFLLMTVVDAWLRETLIGAGFRWHDSWLRFPWYWQYAYAGGIFATFQLLAIAGAMLVGWVVVRLHRAHGLTMLLAFLGIWLLVVVMIFGYYTIVFAARPEHDVLLRSWAHTFRLVFRNAMFVTTGTLAGGYLATRRWAPDTSLSRKRPSAG